MADAKVVVAKRFNGGKPGGEERLAALGLADGEIATLAAFFAVSKWAPDFGSTRAEKGHLVEMDLGPSVHASSAPPLLGTLAGLSSLRCLRVHSFIGRSANVVEGFFSLPGLEKLELSHLMKGFMPLELAELTRLTELAITSCKIKTLDPAARFPPNLRKLDLSANAFVTIPPAVFELPKLEELVLQSNNKLKNAEGAWAKLPKLARLDVSYTAIKALPDALQKAKHLVVDQ